MAFYCYLRLKDFANFALNQLAVVLNTLYEIKQTAAAEPAL